MKHASDTSISNIILRKYSALSGAYMYVESLLSDRVHSDDDDESRKN